MHTLKRILLGLALLLALGFGLNLSYVLPRHEIVVITGTEVKRMDQAGAAHDRHSIQNANRDVYFINAETPDEHQPRVFANEDTRFGFPWYFKFNAADLQAQAQGLTRDGRQLALISSYGWRIRMFNRFPNVLSIHPTQDKKLPFPWFDTLFLVLLGALVLYLTLLWRRWRRGRGHGSSSR